MALLLFKVYTIHCFHLESKPLYPLFGAGQVGHSRLITAFIMATTFCWKLS